MLSLKSLQCFVTLVKTKSFTRTAEELYLTQPTISKILQQLEEQLPGTTFGQTRSWTKKTN